MGGLRGALDITLVEFHHAARRMQAGDGRCLKDLVIQGNGQFPLAQARPNEQMKLLPNNPGLRDGFPFQRVDDRPIGELNVGDDEPTSPADVSEMRLGLSCPAQVAYNFKFISVTAPSEALVTWAAYLASTPRV